MRNRILAIFSHFTYQLNSYVIIEYLLAESFEVDNSIVVVYCYRVTDCLRAVNSLCPMPFNSRPSCLGVLRIIRKQQLPSSVHTSVMQGYVMLCSMFHERP